MISMAFALVLVHHYPVWKCVRARNAYREIEPWRYANRNTTILKARRRRRPPRRSHTRHELRAFGHEVYGSKGRRGCGSTENRPVHRLGRPSGDAGACLVAVWHDRCYRGDGERHNGRGVARCDGGSGQSRPHRKSSHRRIGRQGEYKIVDLRPGIPSHSVWLALAPSSVKASRRIR